MQAAFYESTGSAADVLQLGEVPDPQPAAGEVRVHLRWSGVNPSDVKSRAGLRSKQMPFARVIPHSDGMGAIDAVGEGVSASRIGERVWVWNAAWGRANGTAAQYVTLPQRQAVALPEAAPDEAGACVGIPALTALHAVRLAGGVEGRTVLVAGGAGAVGHYAIQFARLLGAAKVITTVSSPEKAQVALDAGAHLVIDYKREDVGARVREATGGLGVDRVIEVDIAANGLLDLDVLRHGGECVIYGSGKSEFTLPFFPLISRHVAMHFFIVYNLATADRHAAQELLHGFLARGELQHRIAERYQLSEIVQAHQSVESGRAMGNVVVRVG
ncbi:MAG TPA: NADPH:quinone reductase [Ramlibacter sp.]|nr:NADPH:quinone reductase [Ramlibacter sp.]